MKVSPCAALGPIVGTQPLWQRAHAPQATSGHATEVVAAGEVDQRQGCIRREGASEAAPAAVTQAVGGGCQSGWGRLLSVTNAVEAGTWRQGDSSQALARRHGESGGGYPPPPIPTHPWSAAWHRGSFCG